VSRTSIPARRKASRQSDQRTDRRSILLVGPDQDTELIGRHLAELHVEKRRARDQESAAIAIDGQTIAMVAVCLGASSKVAEQVGRLARIADCPIYAVVPDDASPATVRSVYAAGAAGVIDWPREALIMARFLAQMLSLRLAHGRAKGPDTALRRAVRSRLRLLHQLHEQPRLTVRGGVVSVSGNVPSLPAKQAVEASILEVPGVTGIDAENLYVVPEPTTDRTILQACRRILRGTLANAPPGNSEAKLSCKIDRGCLTISGKGINRSEIDHSRELVSNVRGVREIRFEITRSADSAPPDRRLASRLQSMLRDLLAETRIRVAIYLRTAVLSGEVRDLPSKQTAVRWVERTRGIDRVVDKLVVRNS